LNIEAARHNRAAFLLRIFQNTDAQEGVLGGFEFRTEHA
jgi:hypothetical protein